MIKAKEQLSAVSLFSGCGGLDLGLKRAGFKLLLGTDLEPACEESFKLNFPNIPFFCGSVTELSKEMLEKYLGKPIPKIDLLVGGPPCPPFSKSRFYRKEKARSLDDPVGLETFNGYFRSLELLKPRAFLLENVAGLAYKVHSAGLEFVYNKAESLGYSVSHKVLNAADFGVPQLRERCIVIGVKSGSFQFPEPTHLEPGKADLFGQKLPRWKTTGEVLNDLDTTLNADDTGHYAGGQHNNLLKQVPPGENYLFFTRERGHPKPIFKWRSRYWSFLLKLSPQLPSWTIQARRSNNMGPFHWRNRILRIEEIKRLQTFPDTFKLAGNVEQQWRQIGNAVPPLLAEVLGIALFKSLNAK